MIAHTPGSGSWNASGEAQLIRSWQMSGLIVNSLSWACSFPMPLCDIFRFKKRFNVNMGEIQFFISVQRHFAKLPSKVRSYREDWIFVKTEILTKTFMIIILSKIGYLNASNRCRVFISTKLIATFNCGICSILWKFMRTSNSFIFPLVYCNFTFNNQYNVSFEIWMRI